DLSDGYALSRLGASGGSPQDHTARCKRRIWSFLRMPISATPAIITNSPSIANDTSRQIMGIGQIARRAGGSFEHKLIVVHRIQSKCKTSAHISALPDAKS